MLQAIERVLFRTIDWYYGVEDSKGPVLEAEDMKRIVRCAMLFRPAIVNYLDEEKVGFSYIAMPVILGRAVIVGTGAAFLPRLVSKVFPSFSYAQKPLVMRIGIASALGILTFVEEYLRARHEVGDPNARHLWTLVRSS